jgi:hypothetical protein
MIDSQAPVPAAAAALRKWLSEGRANVGEVRVVGVDVGWDEDAEGQPILRFNVALADPSSETWPVEDIAEFHRRFEEHAAEVGLDVSRYVGLATETQEELDLT